MIPSVPTMLASAQLPARYEAACRAVAECDAIDEVKAWTDKAAALASYARQAKDTTLHMMALRIQARAMRREGELSAQLGHAKNQHALPGSGKSKVEVLREAGISTSAAHRAERIAAIPADSFERQIESARPPTITALADQGRMPRSAADVKAQAARARQKHVALRMFVRFCAENDPAVLAQATASEEGNELRRLVAMADQWLDRFVTALQ